MSRYIDAEEFKEWVANWFYKHKLYHPYSKTNTIPITELYDILEQMPVADVQEVVRCKDCIHTDLFYPYCTIWEAAIDGDGYCYKGEKE